MNLRRRLFVRGSVWSLVPSTCFFIGDILLLAGRPNKDQYPVLQRDDVDPDIGMMLSATRNRLRVGALLGVVTAPLWAPGSIAQARSLRGGRRARWMVAGLMLSAHALSPFMHGSFGPMGEAFQDAEQAIERGAGQDEVDRLVGRANRIRDRLGPAYRAYGLCVAGASVLMTERILRGQSDLPRWAALVVPPALPIITMTRVTGSRRVRESRWRPLQGSGLSLGLMASFAASAIIGCTKDRKKTR